MGLHCGASLSSDCGAATILADAAVTPTVSEMTYYCQVGRFDQPTSSSLQHNLLRQHEEHLLWRLCGKEVRQGEENKSITVSLAYPLSSCD